MLASVDEDNLLQVWQPHEALVQSTPLRFHDPPTTGAKSRKAKKARLARVP
jgi:hypothetical protein